LIDSLANIFCLKSIKLDAEDHLSPPSKTPISKIIASFLSVVLIPKLAFMIMSELRKIYAI
jgi:hypothetical protein